jgi:transcriptional regulator with XRE-family HTH domain
MEPRDQFGVNLRRTRLRVGLSQEALGHNCGLHPTEVSRLERATRDPRLGTLVKLARALDTTPSALLRGIK